MNIYIRKSISKIALYSALIILSILMIFPFYWVIRTSLMDINQIFLVPLVYFPKPILFGNYAEAFRTYPFGRYMLNSLFITALFTLGVLISSSLCAFGFSRIKWKGRNLIFNIVLSGMMLPGAVTVIPTYMEWSAVGIRNSYLPLIIPAWLGGGAFYIFLLKQFFMSIPRALDESAFIDGAGFLTIYARIILPLTKPAMIVVMLFAFLNSWNDFLNPLIYISQQSDYTISVGMQLFMTGHVSAWSSLMATAAVVILPGIALFFVGQKFLVEGIVMTGIKG